MIFVYLVFSALVAGLAVLPVLPAILEWQRPTDTAPLRVVQRSEVDVRHLADGFRTWISRVLAEAIAACRQTGVPQQGESEGTRYLVVADATQTLLTDAEAGAGRSDRVLASCGDLRIPGQLTLAGEVYAAGSVTGGEGTVYRAILADGDITLGPRSRTLRWLHSGGSVLLGAGSVTHGRVSAERDIVLGPECGFERLHAARVAFGPPGPELPAPPVRNLPVLGASQLRGGVVMEVDAGRWLIKGSVEIPPDTRVETNLVVTGRCRLRHGVVLAGSVKSHDDLVLEDDVEVRGGVVSERDVFIGSRCRIDGPVVAERAVDVAAGTTIGAPGRPTTVTALDFTAVTGVVVHGTVWAHRRGRVAPGPAA